MYVNVAVATVRVVVLGLLYATLFDIENTTNLYAVSFIAVLQKSSSTDVYCDVSARINKTKAMGFAYFCVPQIQL